MGPTQAPRLTPEDFQSIVEEGPDLICVVTVDGTLLYGSPALADVLGVPAQDLPGQNALAFVDPEEGGELRRALASAAEGNTSTRRDFRVRNGSGRWRTIETIAKPFAGRPGTVALHSRDVTERKAAEDLLLYQAVHDALTGLPNRAAFIERLERSMARARHKGEYQFAVLYLDLDRFKLVNDSLGHMCGDQLLITIAKRLAACLRPGDMVAHVGGDEFTLLVDQIGGAEGTTALAERIHKALALPFNVAGQEVFASASIGIALSASGYERPEDLLRDADTAMYRAKAHGSGRYELFDRVMHQRTLARLKLETDLRRAVERCEFRLHYQPIVCLKSGEITGFEALVRWQHPERGLVPPIEFITAAEEMGLIIPISSWVLREACRQAKVWQQRFPRARPLSMSMNFTSTHFTRADLMSGVEEALRTSGLEGRCLAVEITESVMMTDLDTVIAVLLALKSLDVSIHIDDFGTGYSSLSYLQSLPTDALKIDQSFVSRINGSGSSAEATVMVRTIIEMAHNLGRHVIAEGIETASQLALLRDLGCEYGQGYYFSRPLAAEAAGVLLVSQPRWP